MATYYFGLNINNSFSEIADKVESLKNLNLSIRDLDKIRGIFNSGLSSSDLKNLSGLIVDAEKVSFSLQNDSSVYGFLTSNVFDKYSSFDTNIKINGALGAAAYKYNYVDFAADTPKTADISTSRVSSWSTFESPATDTSPISYGGEVAVQGPIELSKLELTSPILPRKFAAELPTHRIMINVAGQNIYAYAMKGIPLTFDGFFRTANVGATVAPLASGIKPSWVIKDTSATSTARPTEYADILATNNNSNVSVAFATSINRTVEFYYPPSNITNLTLPRINLIDFPRIVLPNLTRLDLNNNDLREFINLSSFTNLRYLDLSFNNLTRAINTNLRSLNNNVVSRIPSGLTTLVLGNCYTGRVTGSFSSLGLTTLNLISSQSNNRRFSGQTPAINPNTIQNYLIDYNLFTSIHSSVLNSSTLKVFSSIVNVINQTNIQFNSTVLESLVLSSNYSGRINIIDVSNKPRLLTYSVNDVRYDTNIENADGVQNIFDGCTVLRSITMRNSNAFGNFPSFQGCSGLQNIDFVSTDISGASQDFVLTNTTFDSCRAVLRTLDWESTRIPLLPLEENTFKGMLSLTRVNISSRKFGLNGTIPTNMFSECRALTQVYLNNNNLTGTFPNFATNQSINYISAFGNQFEGEVPSINKISLRNLYLQINKFTTFTPLRSTSLVELNLSFNLLTDIPDLSNLTALQNLQLSDNQFSTYATGSFSTLTSIRTINLSNNRLEQSAVDQIIRDMNANYDSLPRRSVVVNLKGGTNSPPSNSKEIRDIILKLASFAWNVSVN
jgi:Leucine-rich repeat (LRR) protein